MLVENEQYIMTGISELFSGRLSVVFEVVFGHVCCAVRMNHCARMAFAGGDAGVHVELLRACVVFSCQYA